MPLLQKFEHKESKCWTKQKHEKRCVNFIEESQEESNFFMPYNLLSVRQLVKSRYFLLFDEDSRSIYDKGYSKKLFCVQMTQNNIFFFLVRRVSGPAHWSLSQGYTK